MLRSRSAGFIPGRSERPDHDAQAKDPNATQLKQGRQNMLQRLEQPMKQSHKQKTQADQTDHSSHSALQNHSTLAQDPPAPQATPTHNRAGLTGMLRPGLRAQLREIREEHRRLKG